MQKKIKEIIDLAAKALAELPKKSEDRVIFLNKIEAELHELRQIYT